MKTVKGNPITGGRTEMSPRRAATSSNSSQQAAQQVSTPPAPFKNSGGIANAPVGRRNMAEEGQTYGNTSVPGNHPTRSPGSPIPSMESLLQAVGYRQPTNFTNRPVHAQSPNAGFESPSKARHGKPKQRGFKTHGGIFNEGYALYKQRGS